MESRKLIKRLTDIQASLKVDHIDNKNANLVEMEKIALSLDQLVNDCREMLSLKHNEDVERALKAGMSPFRDYFQSTVPTQKKELRPVLNADGLDMF